MYLLATEVRELTKENLHTKYFLFTYNDVTLKEKPPIMKENLCILFFHYRWSWVYMAHLMATCVVFAKLATHQLLKYLWYKFKFYTHMHLCTVHVQSATLAIILSIHCLLVIFFLFATCMSITSEIFGIETSNLKHMCTYVLCICTYIIWTISWAHIICQPYLFSFCHIYINYPSNIW